MRKTSHIYMLVSVLIFILYVSLANAGDFGMKVGTVNPHSAANTRCADPGYALELTYDHPVASWELLDGLVSFNFNLGTELTYSLYGTAYREKSYLERSDERVEHSVNLSILARPSIRFMALEAYLITGAGPDWMEEDGLDTSITVGKGVTYHITDTIAVSAQKKDVFRHDTGRYSYFTGGITITF